MRKPVIIKNKDSLSTILDKLISLGTWQIINNEAAGDTIVIEKSSGSNSLFKDVCRIINYNKLTKDIFYLIDSVLLYLLYKKEKYLLLGNHSLLPGGVSAKKLTGIIDQHYDYRLKIKNKIINKGLWASAVDYRLYQDTEANRLVLLLTHRCQLRCKYCRVRKFPAVMNSEVMRQAIELLFTSYRENVELQFFGGEPLLEFRLLKKATDYANRLSRKYGKDISFIVSTNGLALSRDKIEFLKENNFTVEISCDGPRQYQLKNRRAPKDVNYYQRLLQNMELAQQCGLNFYIIMVIMPEDVGELLNNFSYLADKGFSKIQINYALGTLWSLPARRELIRQLAKIKKFIRNQDYNLSLINDGKLRREPVVLNSELTVDCDGGIFYETGICLEEDFYKMKRLFRAGDIYKTPEINSLSPSPLRTFYLLSNIYANYNRHFREIILNNIDCGVYLRRRLRHRSDQ